MVETAALDQRVEAEPRPSTLYSVPASTRYVTCFCKHESPRLIGHMALTDIERLARKASV